MIIEILLLVATKASVTPCAWALLIVVTEMEFAWYFGLGFGVPLLSGRNILQWHGRGPEGSRAKTCTVESVLLLSSVRLGELAFQVVPDSGF